MIEMCIVMYMLHREDERKKEGMRLTFNLHLAVRLHHWACNC